MGQAVVEAEQNKAGPRVLGIVQARMGSSRLPGKVLKRLGGRSLLAMAFTRLRRSTEVHQWVLATTREASDDRLEEYAAELGVPCLRGSTDDVLDRYHEAAQARSGQVIVRVTGDCPLIDPGEVDRVVRAFLARARGPEGLDYLSNAAGGTRLIPHGLDVEVFSREALARAWRDAPPGGSREHVTPYLYRSGLFRAAVSPPEGPDRSDLRLTVDTPQDLALMRSLVAALGPDPSAEDALSYLEEHPELRELNAGVRQKGLLSDGELRARRVAGQVLLGRADGGPGLGFGHVARVGALLEAWVEQGGVALLLGRGIQGAFRERLTRAGVQVEELALPLPMQLDHAPEQQGWAGAEELDATLEVASRVRASALVVDGYRFGPEHLRGLQAALPVLAIDDLARFAPVSSVLLNPNMGFPRDRYPAQEGTRLLVGHEYTPLRAEFRVRAAERPAPTSGSRPRVILSFGGADPAGLSAPMLRALLDATLPPCELELILGRGVGEEARQELARLATRAASGPHRVSLLQDVSEMAEQLSGASLALIAAGSTAWELLALGVPPLVVPVADNQRAVARGIAAQGVGVDLGWHEELEPAKAASAVAGLLDDEAKRAEMARRGRALIDGRGVFRALDALLDAIEARARSQATPDEEPEEDPR